METRSQSLVAGLCLGVSSTVGGMAIVTAALYALTCLLAWYGSMTIPNA
jgi:hypothetical protein